MSTNDSKLNDLRREYDSLLPRVTAFAETLKTQILSLLTPHSLTLGFPIEFRVKEWESIEEKLKRKNITIGSVLELGDFIGLRLVLLFKRDLRKTDSLLRDNFTVNSFEDTAHRMNESQFGYQSIHYSISMPDTWHAVPAMRDFRGLHAEVQVRTVSQHIWAAVSHKLQYKQENAVPSPLKRSIFRISAILETVDLEIDRMLEDRNTYVTNASISSEDLILNVDLVQAILKSKWPKQNELLGREDYADLLADLAKFGITSTLQLNDLIDKQYDEVMKQEQELVSFLQDDTQQVNSLPNADLCKERVTKSVYFTLVGLTRTALRNKFPENWVSYLFSKPPR
jgi:putative GTP pyrophosphokinase